MDRLTELLSKHRIIGIDTSIFIYHFEANPKYLAYTSEILEGIQNGLWHGVTSVITLMEINVPPLRLGHHVAAQNYEALLANFPNLQLIDMNRDIARKAAQLRAEFNLRPADAIHIATSMTNKATAWISNDKSHQKLAEDIQIFLLNDFVA